jgi:dihydrofolate reductase
MRKIIVGAFISLDGVMQAPGGPDEDPTGGFTFGGWFAPQFDDAIGAAMGELFGKPFALLLGRKTYDIFAAHWPYQKDDFAASLNGAPKYVATRNHDMRLAWENSQTLGEDVVASLRDLKKQDGPDLLTQGSTELVHTLLRHDLVDEFNVLTAPLVLGKGKRLFSGDASPGTLKLTSSQVSPNGVVIARYRRAGAVTTGSFASEIPSQAELERRRNLV